MDTLLDDLELYSDLILSVGTGIKDRPLTPIEASDLIIRLEKETGETKAQTSKRLGIGRKKKISTMDKPNDTSQLTNFINLQNLSKKNSHMLGFRENVGKIPFTIGSIVAELPNPDDHNIILKTVLASYDTDKKIVKDDVVEIVAQKKHSPESNIEEIIENVMKVKPITDHYYLIGVSMSEELLKKLNNNMDNKDKLKNTLQEKFKNIKISSVSIKGETVFISLDELNFEKIENERKQSHLPITVFFNQKIEEIFQND